MRVWVNFKELRAKLKFEDVLRHYKVEVRRKGTQHQGFCPLPGHDGKGNSPSFSANLERGIFRCFGCGAQGNVLEFAALMQGIDPKDGDALRSVAVELQQRFFPDGTGKSEAASQNSEQPPRTTPVIINAPLDFELKDLDASHAYLSGRGFSKETLRHFGVGFCSRGLLKDRIAIPLHDRDGRLLGYAGRVVDNAAINEESPKYRLPSRRERGGIVYEFRKSLFVYNGHRVHPQNDELIVVEGYPSVWWLTQQGFPRVVALMGSDCSDEQLKLIAGLVRPSGRIWFVPDGDKAGERLAESFLTRISQHRFVRWVRLEQDKQPTDLSKERLQSCFAV